LATFPIVLPVVFPFSLSSQDPICSVESARKLSDRILELREMMALLLGLPLDTPITSALNFGAGLMGTRNQDSRYIDNTHFRLDADQVMTRSASPGFVVWDNPAAITNDIGLGGPLVNCRDQVAAFPINSKVHFYWITNGTILGSLSSLAPPYPAPGPVLPPGYFLGAYAGAMLLDASSFLVPGNIRGRWTVFKAARQVPTGASTFAPGALQSVSVASCVPSNAEAIRLQAHLAISGGTSAGIRQPLTMFDGLEDVVGTVQSSDNTNAINTNSDVVGVMEAPNYGQLLKITVPPAIATETLAGDVKILGFSNPSLG
jgi:hypothetical protein